MFAGIGYFTIPLALNGNVKQIISIEKNPGIFKSSEIFITKYYRFF